MEHESRGAGTVVEQMADGRTRVAFDSGEEHRYRPSSMHKLRPEGSAPATTINMTGLDAHGNRRSLLGFNHSMWGGARAVWERLGTR